MESQTPATVDRQDGPVQQGVAGSNVATKVAKLLHRIAADEIEKYEQSRIFPFPFFLDERFLKKLHDEVGEIIAEVPISTPLEFKSETRFQDLSTVRFDSFDRFLDKAGDKKDPESTVLTWSRFAVDDNGEPVAGEVRVEFVTEKRLVTQDATPGEFNHAFIKLIVSGSDQAWVEKTFNDLVPYMTSTKLGGIYRPLWLFRNKWFINVLSHVISWIGFFIGIHFAGRLFSKELRVSRVEVLKKILAESDVATKFDLYATQILTPSRTPWWEPIVVISCGAVTFVALHLVGMTLFPKLTPNSSIAIGLSDRRAQQYMNVFKFVVFTVIICGVIIPVLVELIKKLL